MARIVGVDIPRNKKISYALCTKANIDKNLRVHQLTEEQVVSIRNAISELGYLVEGELRSSNAMNIKRLKDIGTYKGIRHRRGLPVNGQRTKTNARTRKGKKRTIGLGKS